MSGVLAPNQAAADAPALVGTIRGTIDLPVESRNPVAMGSGYAPVYLHAFTLDGRVVRGAWSRIVGKASRTVTFETGGLPEGRLIVLAATIDPGIVLRALVLPLADGKGREGVRIDATSEVIMQDMIERALVPEVAEAGLGSVVAQGGTQPAAAAAAFERAGSALAGMQRDGWIASIESAAPLGNTLTTLSAALRQVDAEWDGEALTRQPAGTVVLENRLRRQLRTFSGAVGGLGATARSDEQLSRFYTALNEAAGLDAPKDDSRATRFQLLADAVPTIPFPYRETSPRDVLSTLYDEGEPFAELLEKGYQTVMPNGDPFQESEILAAMASGLGPYRQTCRQSGFSASQQTCVIVTNPANKALEVLVRRRARDLESVAAAFRAAVEQEDRAKMVSILKSAPGVANFAIARTDWTSPIGLWRLRVYQNDNAWLGGPIPIVSDAEVEIQASALKATNQVPSGYLSGVLSMWVFDHAEEERLDNFSIRFYWDDFGKTLMDGIISGEMRNSNLSSFVSEYNASNRILYNAEFEAEMIGSVRVSGSWVSEDGTVSGRFEMIRGAEKFSI